MGWAALLVSLLLLWPGAGHTQYWATRDVCTPDGPVLHVQLFEPIGLETAQQRAAQVPNGVGKFWRIEGPDGAVSHLFGTYHVTDRVVLQAAGPVLEVLRDADVAAFEYDAIPQSRRAIEQRATYPGYLRGPREDWSLGDLDLPRRVEDAIRSRTHGLAWGRDAPDYLTLGGLTELLLGDPCADFTYGVLPILDHYLYLEAYIADVPVTGLERESDFVAFYNRPENAGAARAGIAVLGAFLLPVRDNDWRELGLELYLSGRLALWHQADLAALIEVYGADQARALSDAFDAYLLDDRNRIFVEAAEPLLRDGGAFVAVGAAHLPGPLGMIELLRADGFTVTRIPLQGEAP